MPVIEVHLLEGYAAEDQQRLAEVLTDASRMVVPAPPDAVTVMIHTLKNENYYRGRTRRTPAPALPDPCMIVQRFLEHLGHRNFEQARKMVSDEFVMQFPGAAPMHDFDTLLEWAKPRYRSIEKQIQGTEAVPTPGDATVVYCRGTLSGEWPDGTTFSDIRFIDRFELVNGIITRQEVWNDLGEVRGQDVTAST